MKVGFGLTTHLTKKTIKTDEYLRVSFAKAKLYSNGESKIEFWSEYCLR